MENKKERNEEIQSRREFFKKAAKGALPILGAVALGPLLNSCYPLDDDIAPSGCGNSCSGSCDSGCTNNCDSSCGGDCWCSYKSDN